MTRFWIGVFGILTLIGCVMQLAQIVRQEIWLRQHRKLQKKTWEEIVELRDMNVAMNVLGDIFRSASSNLDRAAIAHVHELIVGRAMGPNFIRSGTKDIN